jgi:hypothetical protein
MKTQRKIKFELKWQSEGQYIFCVAFNSLITLCYILFIYFIKFIFFSYHVIKLWSASDFLRMELACYSCEKYFILSIYLIPFHPLELIDQLMTEALVSKPLITYTSMRCLNHYNSAYNFDHSHKSLSISVSFIKITIILFP